MRQPSPSGIPAPSLGVIEGQPGTMALQHAGHRDQHRRTSIVRRIAAEFREMPGLVLTVQQASRFLGVEPVECERVLAQLARHGVLRRAAGGSYMSA